MKNIIVRFIFSLLFYKSGVAHFKNKDMFLKIVPSYLPFKHAIVKYSGILEFIIAFYVLGAKNRSRVRKVVQGFGTAPLVRVQCRCVVMGRIYRYIS